MRATRAAILGSLFSTLVTPALAGNWNGLYIGGLVGAWGNADTHITCVGLDAGRRDECEGAIESGAITSHFSSGLEGVIGGAAVGYNFEFGQRLLLGIEADISASSIDADRVYTHPSGSFFNTIGRTSQELDYLGTVRGRVGYRTGNWLLFATGGWAYGRTDYRYSLFIPRNGSTALASISETNSGWAAGGGAEVRLAERWSVKAEYLFFDLGDERLTSPLRRTDGTTSQIELVSDFETQGNIARVGFNYSFGGSAPAPIK